MTQTTQTPTLPPVTPMDERLKKIEAISRCQLIRADKIRYKQEQEGRDLDNAGLVLDNESKRRSTRSSAILEELFCLRSLLCSIVVDEDKTIIGSEPAVKPAFDAMQMDIIRDKILVKVSKL